MTRNAKAILLGLALVLATPVGAQASSEPEKRKEKREREHRREKSDCRRSSCSDDHGGDGERRKCTGLIAMCDAVIVIPPTPLTPGQDAEPTAAPTAMFPPNPARLAELIQTFASGMGKAVGDLAGAIAAFPPALLL